MRTVTIRVKAIAGGDVDGVKVVSGDNMTQTATMPETVEEPVDAPAGSYAYRPVRFEKGHNLYFFNFKTTTGERIRWQ